MRLRMFERITLLRRARLTQGVRDARRSFRAAEQDREMFEGWDRYSRQAPRWIPRLDDSQYDRLSKIKRYKCRLIRLKGKKAA